MKKKGFTLIELLAVMVVLAILSLITVPIVLGAIRNARETSEERSFNLYIGAVRQGLLNYATANNKAVYEEVFTWNDFQDKYGPYIEGTNLKDIECQNATVDENGFFTFKQCSLNNEEDNNNTLYDWDGNEVFSNKDNIEYACENGYVYNNTSYLCEKSINIDSIIIGDVDGDRIIDIIDVTQVQNYLSGKIKLSDNQMIASDVNGDNEVTDEDMLIINKKVNREPVESKISNIVCPTNLKLSEDNTKCIGTKTTIPKVKIKN